MSDFQPFTWRASTGYLPPPLPPQPQPAPDHRLPTPFVYIPFVPMLVPPPPPPPQPPAPPIAARQPCTCCPHPPPPPRPTSAAPPASSVSSATAVDQQRDPFTPPELLRGMRYLYGPDMEHTVLHIFNKAAPIWEERYAGQRLEFKIFKVSVWLPVGKVIENVLRSSERETCEGWAVTEVLELGDGKWSKVKTMDWGGEPSKANLATIGWGPMHGKTLPPVWLAIHRINKNPR